MARGKHLCNIRFFLACKFGALLILLLCLQFLPKNSHRVTVHRMTSVCYMCSSFRCSRNSTLVKHHFEERSYEPNFMYACHVEHCPRAFTLGSMYSSLSHVTRKHPNWKELLDQAPPITRPKPHNHQTPLLQPLEPEGDLEGGHDPHDINVMIP